MIQIDSMLMHYISYIFLLSSICCHLEGVGKKEVSDQGVMLLKLDIDSSYCKIRCLIF